MLAATVCALSAGSASVAATPTALNFGDVAFASSATQTISFSLPSGVKLGEVSVVTQGAANLDFTAAIGTSCKVGSTAACKVIVKFHPTAAGIRLGAVVLADQSGNALVTVPLYGVALGPVATFAPGTIETIAGQCCGGYFGGDNGPAKNSQISYPTGVGVDAAGNIYIGDSYNAVIRKIDTAGIITTFAGTLKKFDYTGDGGPATSAKMNQPGPVRVDGAGNVYICDEPYFTPQLSAVRMVNSAGIISTFAGLAPGTQICSAATNAIGDGCPANQASVSWPTGIAFDAAGNIYIGDAGNQVIRKVDIHGIISTFAGTLGASGYAGDGGPALAAVLNLPQLGGFDAKGNLYFVDSSNNAIRMITPAGIISTVAAGQFYAPQTLAVDPAGNLYVSDFYNNAIKKVDPSGNVTTLAGGNGGDWSGDGGSPAAAQMYYPADVVLDGHGNLYVPEEFSHTLRKIDLADAPSFTFPDTPWGTVSAAQQTTLLNLGNVPMVLSPNALSRQFVVAHGDTCKGALSIAPNASCTASVAFTPVTVGAVTGVFRLTDNDLPASQSIALHGTAVQDAVTISWTPAALTYGAAVGGAQLDAKVKYFGVLAVPGTYTYTNGDQTLAKGAVLGAGTYTLSVSFTPTNTLRFPDASTTATLQVNMAAVRLAWKAPASIAYGTVLGAAQLDASAPVAGTLTFTPALGTVLGAGKHTLAVQFTPKDAADYKPASAQVSITVNKAKPVLSWQAPSPIKVGAQLDATQLNAAATGYDGSSLAGTYTYSPKLGTILTVGTHTLSLTFLPADAADYTSATKTATIQVTK